MTKYRPSDEEIAAVAKVLKLWKMPSGWQTAAVLALDAAGKVRAPKKMKKRTDEQMTKFLEGVEGVVEANGNEKLNIWESYRENYNEKDWVSNNGGILETVGYLDERPICISLYVDTIKGKKILFWHATSQLVDHLLIDKWLDLNLPSIKRTNAMNWPNVILR
jgi:uncharacterized protein YkvS